MTTKTKRTVGARKTHTIHSFGDQKLIDILSSVMGWHNIDQYKVYRYLQSDRGTDCKTREEFMSLNKISTLKEHLFYTESIWINSVNLKPQHGVFERALMYKFRESYGLNLTFDFRSGRMKIINVGGIQKVYKQIPVRLRPLYNGYIRNRFERQAKPNFLLGKMNKNTFNNLIKGDYFSVLPRLDVEIPVKKKVKVNKPKDRNQMRDEHLKEFYAFRKEKETATKKRLEARINNKRESKINTPEKRFITFYPSLASLFVPRMS